MGDAAHDAEFQAFFLTGKPSQESPLAVVGERAAQGIAHIVAESGYARHLQGVRLDGQLVQRIGACARAPALTIYK